MRALLAPILMLMLAGAAQAQVRSVEVRSPRAFGYFLGDLVQAQADILVDAGFSVQRASLPRPGPAAYWLDLREVTVEETRQGDANRIRLRLTYQSFYAALDARTLEMPGFTVILASDTPGGLTTATTEVPGWQLGVSPLREVQPPKRDDPADYLRPDAGVPRLDPQPALIAALASLVAALVALALLAHDRAWWIFGRRRGRPFTAALRTVRGLSRAGEEDADYRAALLALHRGVDETAGRRVLADDLGAFLDRHPAFRDQAPRLARFFSASRLTFFGRETAAARAEWPRPEIEATLRGLAAAERAT